MRNPVGSLAAGVVAATAALSLSCCFAAQATSTTAELSRHFDGIVEKGIREKAYPGAVLIVGKPGGALHMKAYGALTYEAGATPMALDTIFDVASVSKAVGTATAAMKLLDQGRLAPADPVSKYIPAFAANGKQDVTLRDLMSHVSGLRSYEPPANAEKARQPGQSTADAMIARIAALPLKNARGTTVTYSCLNMQTQARVNETILAGRMDDFLRREVYGPLGMKDTVYRLSEEQISRTAPTARRKDGTTNAGKIHDPIASYHSSETHCPGNAGLFSTAVDLARYCEMILREGTAAPEAGGAQVLRPETVRLMTSVQTPPGVNDFRGLGWDVQRRFPSCTPLNQTDGSRVLAHTGYTGTMIWIDQLSRTYYVFLTNRTFGGDSKAGSKTVTQARSAISEAIIRTRPEYAKLDLKVDRRDREKDED